MNFGLSILRSTWVSQIHTATYQLVAGVGTWEMKSPCRLVTCFQDMCPIFDMIIWHWLYDVYEQACDEASVHVYFFVYLFVCLFVGLSIYLSIYLSICLSVCLSICLYFYLSQGKASHSQRCLRFRGCKLCLFLLQNKFPQNLFGLCLVMSKCGHFPERDEQMSKWMGVDTYRLWMVYHFLLLAYPSCSDIGD